MDESHNDIPSNLIADTDGGTEGLARNQLRYAAYDLRDLAQSFFNTGNEVLAAKLQELSKQVMESEKALRIVYSRQSHQRFKYSQQATCNMIGAVLAMCEIEKQKGV